MDSLYAHYGVAGTALLRENYPANIAEYTATYLATEEQQSLPNPYSYLWPYSDTFSAVCALLEATHNTRYANMLEQRVLSGLEEYHDTRRQPEAYASYINNAPLSDRFYDDNIWLGIDFTDAYRLTGKQSYLRQAQTIWRFIESGMDKKLGGGIYWCEQKKHSKNTCSNAPAAILALKLFRSTKDSTYLKQGQELYHWTQVHLQDTCDGLYFDNLSLKGEISQIKYAYNSGQMMQAAALLHQITGEKHYLSEAHRIAESCHHYFFTPFTPAEGKPFRLLKKGDVWFTAVMLRGFIELYHIDGNHIYLDTFKRNLDYAWKHARDNDGLFNTDFSGQCQNERKWLLTQAAMVEMYARMAALQYPDKTETNNIKS